MLIFDENNNPIMLDSIYVPTICEAMWVLDLNMMDFTLAPILSLEEVTCPSLEVMIKGFKFILPASWSILVYDNETSQLDVVQIAETSGREFTALVFGPQKNQPSPATVAVTDYFIEAKNVGPLLSKHQMLCHPIGSTECIQVGPSDVFNKYLKDTTIGDIIGDIRGER